MLGEHVHTPLRCATARQSDVGVVTLCFLLENKPVPRLSEVGHLDLYTVFSALKVDGTHGLLTPLRTHT